MPQTSGANISELPTLAPSRVIQGPEREVLSMVLAPDGTAAWYSTPRTVADLSALLHLGAPWIFFGYLGLAMAILLILRLRVRRRPRTAGRLYCRRCNYDLTDSPASPSCSECGVELARRRPVIGRSSRARMIPLLIAGLVLALPILWIRTPELLSPKLCGLLDAYWLPAPEWVSTRWPQLKANRLIQGGEQVRRIDLSNGADRVLFTLSRTFTDLAISPSGRRLMLQSKDATGLGLYDASSGRTKASYQTALSRPPGIGFFRPLAVAFTPDEHGVYFQWVAGIRMEKYGISLWDLHARTITTILSNDSWISSGNLGVPGTFTLASMKDAPRFLYTPSFMQAYQDQNLAITLVDAGVEKALKPLKDASPDGIPAVSLAENLAFYVNSTSDRVLAVDLNTGEVAGSLLGPVVGLWAAPAFCEQRQWLAVPAVNGPILIRDIRRKEWIARLTLPKGGYTPHPSFSSDGSKLCAIVQREDGVTTPAPGKPRAAGVTHDGVVWDLSSLIADHGGK